MTLWRVARYWLYIVHRWLGIFACLLFAIWFASGLVMSYVGYPEAKPAQRYQALQPIDWSAVRLDPDGLLSYLNLQRFPRELRLEMLLGEPVYRVIDWDGTRSTVSARSGERAGGRARTGGDDCAGLCERARSTAGHDSARSVDSARRVQSVASAAPDRDRRLRPHRGLRVCAHGRSGARDHARAALLELARLRAALDLLHAAAREPAAWRQVNLWISGPAIFVAISGIWIGILRLRPLRRYAHDRVSPYHGWKSWHHWAGIVGGVFLLTWILSGWLSVNPNGWLSGDSPEADALLRYSGHDGAQFEVDFDALATSRRAPRASSMSMECRSPRSY